MALFILKITEKLGAFSTMLKDEWEVVRFISVAV